MEENRHQQQRREGEQEQRDRRPDGLGELRVLPDELICAILDLLAPRDLGRLACVSRLPFFQQNLVTEVSESCEKTFKFDGFNSLFLYRRWYRCFTTLDAFYKDDGYLERKNISLTSFVLLTDLANTWPARKTWTVDQFVEKYGETAFRISQRSSKKTTMKFKDYVSYMSCQHDEDPLYIFDDKFGESAPSLLEDYSVPTLFKEDFFDVLDEEQRPPFRWLIIGPERSGASWHVDPALTSAWNTLLVGRKGKIIIWWALYPPGRVPVGVTVHVNEEDGDVDIETPSSLQWWLDIYPFLAEKDKPIECTQLPGETIFVPSGWWHCVLNLETTIAVTQNFVNASNFQFVCLDFCPGHLHKGVTRAGWLAVQDRVVKSVKQDVADTNDSDYVNGSLKKTMPEHLENFNGFSEMNFSYDIDFLSKFLSEEVDHYNCTWGEGNCIGQREFREWLHRLWVVKPQIRPLVWKGASLALKADRWLACIMEICASNNLPSPLDDEKLPVGTGSNPVYLVSDYVIKLYVEGGLASSLYSLGTELEFYSILHRVESPLVKHVPDVISSGILAHEPNGSYRICTWAGRGVPDQVRSLNLVNDNCRNDDFPFGIWGKMEFESSKESAVSLPKMWPFLITKRCRGDIFANVRDKLSLDDNLDLASFLGDQLHNLHLLPLPTIAGHSKDNEDDAPRRALNGLNKDSEIFERHFVNDDVVQRNIFSPEWKPFIAAVEQRKKDLHSRLVQWGDPIPNVLIDKVEEYIPHDTSLLISVFKEEDGVYRVCSSPSWIHSDVMDDNIHMEHSPLTHCTNQAVSDGDSTSVDSGINVNIEGNKERWYPAHIIDFSSLFIGDPICDLIPIHIDVFRTDSCLFKRFLESYRFPIGRKPSDGTMSQTKFERASYRAMCYCILHEDNVLGTIFSLRKDLRRATSWEEVEMALWGELNNAWEANNHPIG
ncbi:unnamed protein product [Spirodela intermedia]|uniref:JmjC domain-containing protein n=1 Tax=Spirodela intermedia TaxID=51605 RepID=A0A7I8J4S0_SPIIN|nr:unnamed protein product [Spirodela intermedia]CAA6664381.1 unnamed protein product [Spirodela intermedia]